MSIIDDLNPYPSFRAGQKETIEALLKEVNSGAKIVELNSPTGTGKSLMLTVLCRTLMEYGDYRNAIYTTPQKALVGQLAQDKHLDIVSLLGRGNYLCHKAKSGLAGDCPVPSKLRRKTCPRCPYLQQKDIFLASKLGATTLDKILVDRSIPRPSIMVIDESQGLEEKLLNQSEIEIPDAVELDDLVESSKKWITRIEMEIMKTETKMEAAFERNMNAELKGFIKEVDTTKMAKELVRFNRILTKAKGVLRVAESDPTSFIITKDRAFKMMSGRQQFQDMIMNVKLVVLASGTPCTRLLVNEYQTICAPHPIDVSRRMIYFDPIGRMNVDSRDATMEIMGPKIAELHNKHHRSTIVHCHSYPIATRLGNIIYDEGARCQWVNPKDREGSIKAWMDTEDTVLMAVACEEGLDLAGEKYPLNIIAKVPFGFRGDEWMLTREKQDKPLPNYQHFEDVRVATAIQQAAGRTTRGPDDFSETYIMDSSFEAFYNRNYNLMQPWFKEALRRRGN
jgi:Rad3-related DNA helicase